MTYLTTEFEDLPEAWQSIVESFSYCVAEDIMRNSMPEVTDVEYIIHYGLLKVLFKGGDIRTDSYATIARAMSGKFCFECSTIATRHVFGVPKCDECA